MSETDLTITEIHKQIDDLRKNLAITKESLDPTRKDRQSIQLQEDALRASFEKTMENLLSEKRNLEVAIAEISQMMNKIALEIEEKQKLLALLMKKEADKRQLETMMQDLDTLLEELPAWNVARIYQREDTLFALQAFRDGKNGILNANDMGLGKTFETVILLRLLENEWIRIHGRRPNILLLTKKSLVMSTIKEIYRWDKSRIMFPLLETNAKAREMTLDFILNTLEAMCVTNYETLNTLPTLREFEWDIVVIDEVHRLKGGANLNGQTKIFKNAKLMCERAKFIIMLSGTPMVNHPREMWAYLHIFDPVRFDSLRRFESLFDFNQGDVNSKEFKLAADKLLKQALKGQVIRRRLDEVGIEMPEHNHIFRYLEMHPEQQELNDMMAEHFHIFLKKNVEDKIMLSATAIIAQITRLRQIGVWPPCIQIKDEDDPKIKHAVDVHQSAKISEAMDMIDELTDLDEQLVIACTFNEPMWEIQRRCHDRGITCEVLEGGTSKNSMHFEKRFQDKKLQVLCINLTMGEGLNLHKDEEKWTGGASNLIMLDLWWTPMRNDQMAARIRRPGIKQPTNIHIFHNEGSIDSFIAAIVEDKANKFANIMESNELRPASEWLEMFEAHVKMKKGNK